MRVLITGASGFAGAWLARACAAAGDEVVGVSRSGSVPDGCGRGVAVDLCSAESVAALVRSLRPDVVYHLAALSHVGRSWEDGGETVRVNVGAAVSVLEAVRAGSPSARVVWASSCEVYGSAVTLPVTEDAVPAPATPYAVSKLAGEQLALVYARAHGLRVVVARPFNHTGPGQAPRFIVSSLAQQAARARLEGVRSLRIVTGNPDTRRDFTDVRDVVRAYRMLAAADDSVLGDGVYNVSSGESVSAAENVATVAALIAPIEVSHVVDPARVRAHEVMDHRGSFQRLHDACGWKPEIPIRQTIADTIDWWETELRAEPSGRAGTGVRH